VNVPKPAEAPATKTPAKSSQEVVLQHAANELIFGVVGHVGSGTSEIARQLKSQLGLESLPGGPFDAEVLKASGEIVAWLKETGETAPDREPGRLSCVEQLQDLGNRCRNDQGDAAALARRLVQAVRRSRAEKQEEAADGDAPVIPDGARRAWILDSLRHPSEVELLRHIYQDAFVLVGVVCDEDVRTERLQAKYDVDGSPQKIKTFMARDADDTESLGQKVADSFHMSDFFVDNTENRTLKNGAPNEEWNVPDQLGRLIRLLTHSDVVRPTSHETAMHAAYGAQVRSACLSRQVGAALVSADGQLLATGTNEVPRPGGGVYGQSDRAHDQDDRCAFRRTADHRFCSNTREQNTIIDDLIQQIEGSMQAGGGGELPAAAKLRLRSDLRKSRIGGLIEFSRAVHAEMDALLGAGRQGHKAVGAALYVTTFPCHYCARHIVAAGVDEVQYIEPYPKSLAIKLHDDAICVSENGRAINGNGGPRRVLFRPFTGVAPRLYRRAFMKDRELKDRNTGGKQIGMPAWGTPWHLRRVSYVMLEAELSKKEVADGGAA